MKRFGIARPLVDAALCDGLPVQLRVGFGDAHQRGVVGQRRAVLACAVHHFGGHLVQLLLCGVADVACALGADLLHDASIGCNLLRECEQGLKALVDGVDRVTIINFSTGDSGNVLSIIAERNEFLRAGDIDITAEER